MYGMAERKRAISNELFDGHPLLSTIQRILRVLYLSFTKLGSARANVSIEP